MLMISLLEVPLTTSKFGGIVFADLVHFLVTIRKKQSVG